MPVYAVALTKNAAGSHAVNPEHNAVLALDAVILIPMIMALAPSNAALTPLKCKNALFRAHALTLES
jgi:hypothetical protein